MKEEIMSYYVYGSSLSWNDYLQAKNFVDDISSSSREAGRRVSMEISHQTREIIASNEALSRENIRMMEVSTDRIEHGLGQIDSTLSAGFDRLSYDMQEISSGISELNSTFHWGFGALIAGIGHMNDALSELIKIAKTPVQTVAFNHFEIARDAFRKGLLQESLEELDKAIKGDHTSPGYKLEWRFHQMVGIIRLGFADCELSLVDLKHAEESFLLAARYAKTDYPEDAARAFLSAGWAAYCQGKMKEALAHTEQAILLHPKLGEALFQAAKVRMALGEVTVALPVLAKAIELDRFYVLKAAGDGDFQKHDNKLREFLEALRQEKYQQLVPRVYQALEKIKLVREHSSRAKHNPNVQRLVQRLESLLADGAKWPLLNILAIVQTIERGFDAARDDIYDGSGKLITSIDFCRIPAGEFMMGKKGKQQRVTISKEFYLGKFLVTQAQWQAVMGNNPSHFKGDSNLPVENVSWNDCQAFIKKLNELAGNPGYRLPTEEEWEYVCRAGSKTDYFFSDSPSRLREYAWYDENSGGKIHPVGQLRPNAWGLYDMLGNVWEWMANRYSQEMTHYRAMRGGSYDNDKFELQCGERWHNHPVYPWGLVGFRVCAPVLI
jgi:tetratricopeptide (TPR) repeat protein